MAIFLFFVGLIFAVSGFASPPLALGAGLLYGFLVPHAYASAARSASKFLLQASVVALGFGMDLHQVLHAGRSGFVYTAAGIAIALSLGWALGRLLGVDRTTSFLISTGTAICGGSAIAAVSPIAEANEEQMAVSLGTVFILNSVALFAFPAIGSKLHLSQSQFGLWSALAIHDTSSVVGATARYGALALAVGAAVKLTRALWIVPLSFGTAMVNKSSARIRWPWFIVLFCLAAVVNTYMQGLHPAFTVLRHLGVIGLTVTLYLIGTGLSMKTIRAVGSRPLVHGLLLWFVVAAGSLVLIRSGWIHL